MKQHIPLIVALVLALMFAINMLVVSKQRDTFQQQNTSLLRQRDSVIAASRWEHLSADTARAYSRSLNLRIDTLLSRASKEDVRIIKDYSDIRAAVQRGDSSFLVKVILWKNQH